MKCQCPKCSYVYYDGAAGQILEVLKDKPCYISELQKKTGLAQINIIKNLKMLSEDGLIDYSPNLNKRGTKNFVTLNSTSYTSETPTKKELNKE